MEITCIYNQAFHEKKKEANCAHGLYAVQNNLMCITPFGFFEIWLIFSVA